MKKNSTKEYILESAFRLFMEKGYKNTTLNELVKVSELSKGAFYHYFESKKEIFDKSIETYFFALAAPVLNYELTEKQTFLENINEYLNKRNTEVIKIVQNLSLSLDSNYMNVVMEAMQMFEHHKKHSLKLLDEELNLYESIIKNS